MSLKRIAVVALLLSGCSSGVDFNVYEGSASRDGSSKDDTSTKSFYFVEVKEVRP